MEATLKEFEADWCGPCSTQEPIVDELDEDRDDLDVEKIDVDDKQDVANEYQVRSLPTIVIETEDGQIVDRFTGVTQRPDLEAAVDEAVSQAGTA